MFDEFRSIYTDALHELTLDYACLFDCSYSVDAVKGLMYQVSFYTQNDTGKHMHANDQPASWSSPKSYNLTHDNEMNYFKARSETIRKAIGH